MADTASSRPVAGPRRESPLQALVGSARAAPSGAGVRMGERAFLGHLDLRGPGDDRRFSAAARKAAGLAPPIEPNTFAGDADLAVHWLGPDQWLVLTPRDTSARIAAALRDNLDGQRASVVDLGAAQTVVRIEGPRARDVLAKGCPLDLHPRAFGSGRCAQSHLAHANVLLRRLSDAGEAPRSEIPRFEMSRFEIVVRRSYAEYLWRWLEDAAREYGVEVLDDVP